ncbi:lysylphosphatidylglycerol synthase transmembrane domain-containing protein [Pectinatus sottacetonis]|uniref:lysylphosphatidylglycerol synthase transmembrane domain-containing protein n=1 Tax=Pectinatus sottacetonis TaxID=1002795 RepID=UPI0018C45207|nr:lysylphosphatidylglycerol synthase transmembrane domain-containing protein [Pectinatus sottacetonis]
MFYKRLIVLLLLVGIISYCVIYFTVDINTLRNLIDFQPWSVAAAFFSVLIGLFLDGFRLIQLVRLSGEKITPMQAARVVFGNYFLALLTPGFSGGAVAQLMFLRYAEVPMGKAAIIVVVRTLISILFLFVCMPFILLSDDGVLPWVSNKLLMWFSLLAIAGTIALIWAMVSGSFDKVAVFIAKRISHKKGRKLMGFYHDNKKAILLLSSSPAAMFKVFIISGLSLIALYAVVPFLLMGLGAKVNWIMVMGRMVFLNLFLYFSPTPGGSGIAEGGFILLFNTIAPQGTVGVVAVGWRLFAEYIPFLVGFYYTIKVFGRGFLGKKTLNKGK